MIKKFPNFLLESASNIQVDDILDIFQKYLDNVEREKIDINITDRYIRVKIIHNPWLKGSGVKILEILSQNWDTLNRSIKMVESMYGIKLTKIEFLGDPLESWSHTPAGDPRGFKMVFERSGSKNFVSISNILELKNFDSQNIGLNLGIDDYILYTILAFRDKTILKFEDPDNKKKEISIKEFMNILNEDPHITNGELSKKYPFIEWKGGDCKTLVNSPIFALVDGKEKKVKSIKMGEDSEGVDFGNYYKEEFVIISV